MIVAAHRGGAGLAPENTLEAYRNAIRIGADYVEIDVRETADGALVIMHDSAVDRTTDGTGEVSRLNASTIARLNAAAKYPGARRQRVPTLEDVARLCRGKIGIYLDHKSAPVRKVLGVLDRVRFGERIVVYGSLETLREYRSLRPRWLLMPGHPADESQMKSLARTIAPVAFDGHALEWTAEQVRQAHACGGQVWMDIMGPTDNPEGYARAVEMGADALQTDYPDRLIGWLKDRGLR